MSSWSPEIANAKLSLCTKKPSQTFAALEGEIQELVNLASRAEELSTRPAWIKNCRIGIFKQAISEKDRQLILRENQSRSKSGLHDMTLSQMTSYLIKYYCEQEAFNTASHIRTNRPFDEDSLQVVSDKFSSHQNNGKEQCISEDDKEKIKEQLYNEWIQNNQQNGSSDDSDLESNEDSDSNNDSDSNEDSDSNADSNSYFVRQFDDRQNGNGNKRHNNDNRNDKYDAYRSTRKPRRYVTNAMVQVNPNSCLKCGSPDHKFTQVERCIYGQEKLLPQPCYNCQVGGHHYRMCIQDKNPIFDTEDPKSWPKLTDCMPNN